MKVKMFRTSVLVICQVVVLRLPMKSQRYLLLLFSIYLLPHMLNPCLLALCVCVFCCSQADYDRSDEYEREDRMDDLYTATAIKSGYLHKKGERRRAWQKRFFVLRPRMLGYYKDSKEYKLLRQIPLSDIRTCAMVEIKKHDYVFGIVTKERTFYVQASSNHERDEWVQEINAAIKQAALIERATASEENDLSTPQPRESPALPGTADTSSTQQQQQQQPPPMMLPEQQQQQARSSLSGPINIVPQAQSRSHRAPQRSFSGMSAGSSSISPGPFSPAGANELSSSYTSQDPVEDIGDNFRQYSLRQANTGDYHSQTAYFGPSPANRSPALQQQMPRSASPQQQHQGVTSSSEDDDDEPPLTPLSGSFQETDTYAAFSNASPSALPPTRPRPVATSTPVTTATAASLAAVTGTSSSASPATSRLRELHGPPSAARHPDPNRTIMTGYLTKQGKRKNWRKRWFSLSSTCLSYSRSHMVRCLTEFQSLSDRAHAFVTGQQSTPSDSFVPRARCDGVRAADICTSSRLPDQR